MESIVKTVKNLTKRLKENEAEVSVNSFHIVTITMTRNVEESFIFFFLDGIFKSPKIAKLTEVGFDTIRHNSKLYGVNESLKPII